MNEYNKDGEKEGHWQYLYLDKKVVHVEGYYKNGKSYGIWKSYYITSNLWGIGNYKDGEEKGLWEYYYRDGKIKRKEFIL